MFPAGSCSCCLLCGSFLDQAPVGPRVIPVGVRTAQQGCADRAVLALEQGPCRALEQEENSPSLTLLLPPTLIIQPISSKRICGVCADHRAFFLFFSLTLLLHSIWCLFSCAASCLLHLNPVRVLHWVFRQVGAAAWGGAASGLALVPWLRCAAASG